METGGLEGGDGLSRLKAGCVLIGLKRDESQKFRGFHDYSRGVMVRAKNLLWVVFFASRTEPTRIQQ